MIGYWNIFAIDVHICGRLFAKVSSSQSLEAPLPTPNVDLSYKMNYSVVAVTAILVLAV